VQGVGHDGLGERAVFFQELVANVHIADKLAVIKFGDDLVNQTASREYSSPGSDVAQVRDFSLKMTTNFKDIDFPDNTLSPTQKSETANGWTLDWNYKNLVSGYQIAMKMPEKLQPGPLAGRISFFAPVSLFFFFFLMLIITTLRDIELHPMNYFFLAAAFFSFHLLLAYLVDHVSIHAAFGISSAVSIFLVARHFFHASISIPCVVPQSPRWLNPITRQPSARKIRTSARPMPVDRTWWNASAFETFGDE